MANVIEVIGTLTGNSKPLAITNLPVKSGAAASILPGYLVIKDGSNAGYVKAAADACATTSEILGVAVDTSTDTASADGVVHIVASPVLLARMKAKTPGSLAATMPFSDYILDVTAGSYTLDQATTTNGFLKLLSYDNTTDGNCMVAIQCNAWTV